MTDSSIPDLSALPELLGSSSRITSLIEDRLELLIEDVFDHIQDILDTGTPADIAAVTKMVLPLVIAVKNKTEATGDDMEVIRQQALGVFGEAGANLNRG